MSTTTIEGNIFEVNAPAEIPLDEFNRVMQRDTYACVRGLVSPEEIEESLKKLRARFSRSEDHPGYGEDPKQVRTNYQKLLVGGESRRHNNVARFFRAFYNPMWEEDVYGMHDIFRRIVGVRNRLAELPEDFATTNIEANGLWTASRIHQYPTGGGFFKGHSDYVLTEVANEKATKFYQVLMLMTQRGKDFQAGGGFVDVGEERIYLEEHFGPGDIVVYDSRTNHGVEDVDSQLPLNLDVINGRVAALVSLYKVMD